MGTVGVRFDLDCSTACVLICMLGGVVTRAFVICVLRQGFMLF